MIGWDAKGLGRDCVASVGGRTIRIVDDFARLIARTDANGRHAVAPLPKTAGGGWQPQPRVAGFP